MKPTAALIHRARALLALVPALLALGACTSIVPEPREAVQGHVTTTPPAVATPPAAIPRPVTRPPSPPPPRATAPVETYTVVVNGVPVRELLFALARDASLNVDIHPDIRGDVTLNAINQSLPQILDRLSRQVDLRYQLDDDLLTIAPDRPVLRTYIVDYINIARSTTNQVSVATQIAATSSGGAGGGVGGGGGGGDNNSVTNLESTTNNAIWTTLVSTIEAMLDDGSVRSAAPGSEEAAEQAGGGLAAALATTGQSAQRNVISNAESGLLTVRATGRQHASIQRYLDQVAASMRRQVLIEATVVEVTLNDRYRAGIDWRSIPLGAGVSIEQTVNAGFTGSATGLAALVINYANQRNAAIPPDDLSVTASLLKEFGDIRVISSPKVMVLNNQTALLKVVDNLVYFIIDVENTTDANGVLNQTVETTPQTVPVGFVMAVTPQISASDMVMLNVRPTITRVLDFKQDPNPNLRVRNAAGDPVGDPIANLVPEIQVREFESIMRTQSGQIAVLGGLMQDAQARSADGIPFLGDIRGFGDLFKFRDNEFTKTELVVFIRPWVVRRPDVGGGDLLDYRRYLPENLDDAEPIPSPSPGFIQ